MARSGSAPWHICEDCLDPLADDLFSLARRCSRFFDLAKADRLEDEYRQLQEASGYSDDRLTVEQQKHRDELLKQMRAQVEPASARELETLYRKYKIDLAVDWLKFNVTVEFAEDFRRTLADTQTRFAALEFRACQILNGDEGTETTWISYPIRRLIDRHYELLRQEFPDQYLYAPPARDELPEDLQNFEIQILDEYVAIEQSLRETSQFVRHVSKMVLTKMAKPTIEDLQRQITEGFEATRTTLSSNAAAEVECYVTLFQMAAIVNKSKKTLARLRDRGKLPKPAVKGGNGTAHEWKWSDVRQILEDEYNRHLPKVFPADHFNRR